MSLEIQSGAIHVKPKQGDPITSAVEIITPEKAREYLQRNARNRKLSRHTIEAYAGDMRAGRWLFTGDPIQFDAGGNLINGQHRLSAIVMSGEPQRMMVIRGLPTQAISHLDQGRKRTVSDILSIEGARHASLAGGAARALMALAGNRLSDGEHIFVKRVSAQLVLEIVRRHPNLDASAQICERIKVVGPSIVAGVHYAAAELMGKRELADAAVLVLLHGVAAYEGDPVFILRERLIEARLAKKPMTREHALRALVYAWNIFQRGDRVQRLYIPKKGVVAMEGLDVSLI